MAEQKLGRGSQPLITSVYTGTRSIMEPTRTETIKPREMTPQEEAELGPRMDMLATAVLSPLSYDSSLWERYPGELIAWSPDGTRIIAHAKDEEALQKLLAESGENPSLCYVQTIDVEPQV